MLCIVCRTCLSLLRLFMKVICSAGGSGGLVNVTLVSPSQLLFSFNASVSHLRWLILPVWQEPQASEPPDLALSAKHGALQVGYYPSSAALVLKDAGTKAKPVGVALNMAGKATSARNASLSSGDTTSAAAFQRLVAHLGNGSAVLAVSLKPTASSKMTKTLALNGTLQAKCPLSQVSSLPCGSADCSTSKGCLSEYSLSKDCWPDGPRLSCKVASC